MKRLVLFILAGSAWAFFSGFAGLPLSPLPINLPSSLMRQGPLPVETAALPASRPDPFRVLEARRRAERALNTSA